MEMDTELCPVDRARLFWSTQDLDSVFSEIQNHLDLLQTRLRTHTASDTELVQSLKLLEAFDWPFVTTPPVVQVVIGSDAEPVAAPPALDNGPAPVSEGPPAPVEYQEHLCSKSCVPTLPVMPESQLWALNPLKVPLVYGFCRHGDDGMEGGVVYVAPCGLRLRNHSDVTDFLTTSESFSLLQSELFSFSPCVSVDPLDPGPDLGPAPGPSLALTPGPSPSPGPALAPDPRPGPALAPGPGPALAPGPGPALAPGPESGPALAPGPGPALAPGPGPGPALAPGPGPALAPGPSPSLAPGPGPALAPGPGPALAPGPGPGPDLSRGQELTPVELCLPEGQRPPLFKYRRDRWPHGCFLTDLSLQRPLQSSYCDCRGRCREGVCPCVSMTTGHTYTHGRLQEPNPNGIFECGPWCSCDPGLCQNRVVQRGLRVRLQVYRTTTCPDPSPDQSPKPGPDPILDYGQDPTPDPRPDRGWGVRCKDDLDQGTFICVYAGVVLQRGEGQSETPPLKQRRVELTTDDEIQLVTEWLPNTTPNTGPAHDSAHIPVIQRGSDITDQSQVSVNGSKWSQDQTRTRTRTLGSDLYLIDARKEGNVSRFFNHSCDPTLFVQNVFTDSHDTRFPNIAFFTTRALKAGTELTWDYDSAPWQEVNGDGQEVEEGVQEVPCLCHSATCRQHFHITDLKTLV